MSRANDGAGTADSSLVGGAGAAYGAGAGDNDGLMRRRRCRKLANKEKAPWSLEQRRNWGIRDFAGAGDNDGTGAMLAPSETAPGALSQRRWSGGRRRRW